MSEYRAPDRPADDSSMPGPEPARDATVGEPRTGTESEGASRAAPRPSRHEDDDTRHEKPRHMPGEDAADERA